jgi:hypothetical protein
MGMVAKDDRNYTIPYVTAPDSPKIPYPEIKQTIHHNYSRGDYNRIQVYTGDGEWR